MAAIAVGEAIGTAEAGRQGLGRQDLGSETEESGA